MKFNYSQEQQTDFWPEITISAQELADLLRVSRHYINKNIQPHIRSYRRENSSNTFVYFDKKELRYWLMLNADFSRQTWRFKGGDPPPQKGTYTPPLIPYQRNKVPSVPVLPFDFLDLPLIFPKEYRRPDSDKVTSAEICYRDMFKAGAIKIQLGSKKTMFYIPGLDSNDPKAIQEWADRPFDDSDIPLLPAMWLPTARYHDMDKIFFSEYPSTRRYIGCYSSNNENVASPIPLTYNMDPLDEMKLRHELIGTVPEPDGSPHLEDDDGLNDLIEHAERYLPPVKIDGTPPTPIDDDPESEESMEDLMHHADQYFQPGDDIEYYDPHHDWYVPNWEDEDVPSTLSSKEKDNKMAR